MKPEEEIEKTTPLPKRIEISDFKKIDKWGLTSFIFGVLAILLFLAFSHLLNTFYLIIFPLFPVLAIIFGIIGLKKKGTKILSVIGIIIGVLVLFITISIYYSLITGVGF